MTQTMTTVLPVDAYRNKILPLRAQAAVRNDWLKQRLAELLPLLMTRTGIDLWIVEQSTPVTVTLATMFGRKGGRGICILPAACNEPDPLNFCHRAGVNRSEVASSDNSYSDHAFAFSYAASMTCIAAR